MKFTIKTQDGRKVLSQLDSGTKCRQIAQLLANARSEPVQVLDNLNRSKTIIRNTDVHAKRGVHVRVYPEDVQAIKDLAKKLTVERELGMTKG